MTTRPLVREPQQARSRQSFDRALDAAVALLVERGSTTFTLVEVAQASGVSTGSMYGRVASKDDLIRVAHAREMERLSAETAEAFAAAPADAGESWSGSGSPSGRSPCLLQRNAPVLSPFMLLANHDDVIAARWQGGASTQMTAEFERALLGLLRRGAPTSGRGWSCTVAYSVLARQLALGSDPGPRRTTGSTRSSPS